MAKKKKKNIGRDLDSVNASLDSILRQYNTISKKDRKALLKKLKKEEKKLSNEWIKTSETKNVFKIRSLQSKISKLEKPSDKIPVNYGIFNFNIKADYLNSLKDKEQYLDGLFHRKMKKVLNESAAPKNENEAKELEGLITQYSKKIRDTKFYDADIVENSINKLTNYRNKLNTYEYSDYIKDKKTLIKAEINEVEKYKEIDSIEKKLKKAKGKEKTALRKKIKELEKDVKNKNQKANKEVSKNRITRLKTESKRKKSKGENTGRIDSDIIELEGEYDEGNFDFDINEEIYKAIEKAILLDGMLIGLQFNFF